MHTPSRLFRLGILCLASTSLSLSGALPVFAPLVAPAFAQAPPAPGGYQGVPDAQSGGGDPPGLAGRLSDLQGTVSYHPAGADQWSPATQNFPVTSGNAYWTEPQASATIEIGDDKITMDGGTELDVTTLDQSQFTASEPQGAIFLGLRDLPDGQALTITTPRGSVQITQPGAYEIVAGDTNDPTSVTVVSGAAHVTASGVDLNVTARQTATVTGADSFQGQVGSMAPDQFLSAQLQRFQPQQQQSAPPQVAQQVRYMTGGSELSQYGTWSESSSYGQVWYPSNVGSDWAPYREGHWAYVAPWGWSWVDDEPWGFAPFHYGRWINDGGRWGWVAGGGDAYGDGYPIYAPALVGFVGFGPGDLGVGFGVGFGIGVGVGWFPLGYGEAFVPWYHGSEGYFRGINRYNVRDYRSLNINNYRNVTINNYRNARFASVAPGAAFAGGARMRGIARPLPAGALARGRPIIGRMPVAPNAHTPGLSRSVAAAYHVPMAAHPAGAGRGPEIRPGGFGQTRPALRPAAGPANARPAAGLGRPGAPGGAGMRPGGAPGPAISRPGAPGARPGLPALRPARPEQAAPGVGHPGTGGAAGERLGRGTGTSLGTRPNAGSTAPHGLQPRPIGGASHPGAPRSASRPAPTHQAHAAPARAPRPQGESRPHESAPRPAPRPMAAPRPMSAPRPAPRPAPAPHPSAPPAQHRR